MVGRRKSFASWAGPRGCAVLVVAAVAAASAGCVERTRELTAAEREQMRPYLSRRDTHPQHRLRVSFADAIELVGYDLDATSWAPGSTITVTWHWKSVRPIGEDWRLFTHVDAPDGSMRSTADDQGIVRSLYPPGRWRLGERIRDVQRITLPADFDAPEAVVYVGIWRNEERLRVTQGPNDGRDRVRAFSLPVAARPAGAVPDDVPTLSVRRATSPIALDGKLDEPAWAAAVVSTPFVDTMSGAPSPLGASVRALWDDQNLYVAFDIADNYLKSPFRQLDDHLWEQDCAEIMLDPGGDGLDYFELQANPLGAVFDTRYDSRRVPQPFGHVDWNSGMRVGVDDRGTPNDDEPDRGYTVELAIPWTAFGTQGAPGTHPTPGTVWRGNFYVMDALEEGMRANGWSAPRVGDFHMPPRFGRLVFEGAP